VLDYLTEVKPYHVQPREFNLIYQGLDQFAGTLTDFDVPAYWDVALDLPQFVSPVLTPYTDSGSTTQSFVSDAAGNAQIWLERPWNDWYNNYLLEIQGVTVIDGGSGYTIEPTVVVTGNCVSAAQMTAVINSAGRVVSVTVDDPGLGYSTTATITFVGGNGSGAVATAQMGNQLVRSIRTSIKYDRCEYVTSITEWQANVVYTAGDQVRWRDQVWSADVTQSAAVFDLADWTRVEASTLNGVDRTMGFYVPTANMPGLSWPLLVDGIDYPGVQVDAPDFNQNTGFDVGNFDINPFDNISLDENGRPTYDPAILDARYSSAYLDPYLGTRPTDINVVGGDYISVFSSHAPEELIPGSEFDTLDFRVYTTPGSDWQGLGHGFPIGIRRYTFDPAEPVISFAGILAAPMTVTLFNETLGIALEPVSYNWANYELTVDAATSDSGDTLLLYVTGTGGGNQLLNATYLGTDLVDGQELIVPFPTSTAPNPPVDSIYEFVIYNGEIPLVPGVDYTSAAEGEFKTRVTFTSTYGATDRINLTALGYGYSGITYSWSLPVFQTIVVTNSAQLTYTLTNSLQGTNPVNLIVTRNGVRARPSESARYIGDGSTASYYLPTTGGYSQGLVANNDVSVYLGQQAQIPGVDFVLDPWDGSSDRAITLLNSVPADGTVILVSVRTAAQYWVTGNQLLFRPSAGLSPQVGDTIEIITWNDTSEQGLYTQVFVGPTVSGVTIQQGYDSVDFDSATVNNTSGSFDFTIGSQVESNVFDTGRPITDPDRLLVSLDGNWLFNGSGYVVDGPNIVILGPLLPQQAVLSVTSFTQSVVPGPMAFRIFQDMRGVQATYRITPETTTATAAAVDITDDVIYVDNAGALIEPNFDANIWGVVTIGAERIMYRYRDTAANTISGLLRGTAGTAVLTHAVGATVYNLGRGNLLPEDYQNYIVSSSTLADGSTTNFVADNITLTYDSSENYDTLPYDIGTVTGDPGSYDYGTGNPFDQLEVYVGGLRLFEGFEVVSANPAQIILDVAPPTGVEVTLLVRRGVTWYQQGTGTASNGEPLQTTNTPAARFLRGL
jgi:hypothetical protein